MRKPRILSMRGKNGAKPGAGYVRVDRRSPWGNPFVLKREADREQVIYQHRRWMLERIVAGDDPYTQARLKELAAADALLCWCRPLRCHAENLVQAACVAATSTPGQFLDWANASLRELSGQDAARAA